MARHNQTMVRLYGKGCLRISLKACFNFGQMMMPKMSNGAANGAISDQSSGLSIGGNYTSSFCSLQKDDSRRPSEAKQWLLGAATCW